MQSLQPDIANRTIVGAQWHGKNLSNTSLTIGKYTAYSPRLSRVPRNYDFTQIRCFSHVLCCLFLRPFLVLIATTSADITREPQN
jgi:hypothetical protein